MAIRKARETGADLVMGTDPDADRVGIAVRLHNNEIVLLNGNQTASILIYYLLKRWKETGKLKGKEYIVKTIVTTELLAEMAMDFNVPCYDVLTGFKYIAEIIKQNEGKMTFIGGGEESYGYLAAEFVRDKDAIMSCALIAEAAAWARNQNKLLMDILEEIYIRYGFFKESLLSVTKKGKEGAEEIQRMMDNFRNNPPQVINGSKVQVIHDYLKQVSFHLISGINEPIHQPKSNVLQFLTEDGSKISIRPSGTEPKIKFYFGVKEKLGCIAEYDEVNKKLSAKIQNIIHDLHLH
jgi:phosphoglucomutase